MAEVAAKQESDQKEKETESKQLPATLLRDDLVKVLEKCKVSDLVCCILLTP